MGAWKVVALGGLVAGMADITFAWVFWAVKARTSPLRILQSVAAGLLGPASYAGGLATALLGLFLHFFIAMTVAALYYLAASRMPGLARQPLPAGALYGVVVYLVMNQIVVPLSAAGGGSGDSWWIGLSVLVHAVGVGVPCAVAARYALQATPPATGA